MFECEICEYSTSRYNNYQRHITSKKHLSEEKRERIYKCDECEYRTSILSNLARHKKMKKDNEDRLFVCEICNYKTLKSNFIYNHYESKLHKEKVKMNEILKKHEKQEEVRNELAVKERKKLIPEIINALSNHQTELVKQLIAQMQDTWKYAIENTKTINGIGGGGNSNALTNSANTLTNSANTLTNSQNTTYNVVQILDYYNENRKDAMTIDKFKEFIKPVETGEFLKMGESKKPYTKMLGEFYQTRLNKLPKSQIPLACYDKSNLGFLVNKDGKGWVIDQSNNEIIDSIGETHKGMLKCALDLMNNEEFMNKCGDKVMSIMIKVNVDQDKHNEMTNGTVKKISSNPEYKVNVKSSDNVVTT